jgi:predicted nuclease of predicted toxin-antitoxin system
MRRAILITRAWWQDDLLDRRSIVIVSKDIDFANLATRLGKPPQILWLRIGNRSPNDPGAVIPRRITLARSRRKAC